ncbi:hypothetical protein TTHERM_00777060 (macronuclear) [Tetrahymena thermophila SB210]|uniref:EF-hand domain-containing protein n=1 Tax=Tetrahymena thermophila (strain SB210) TaxID=312017 RepID=Q23WU9_TETTS|nr:hypothetical protein TTHERM_00777060 [Tetrahymena thermophila SB210]EAS00996.2 hypothetical protein TTHERM_00777060 [Tetrahymena thermophila SB210]|eukprot:XP_001021241.2 hypothetical protein TTHERM_00777060 [Tetrahymena thermophila SB210]
MSYQQENFHLVRGKLLAVMTVQFAESQSEDIEIYQNDDPRKLAEEFIQKNQFDESILEIIVENININKNLAMEEYNKNPDNFKVQKDSDFNNCDQGEEHQAQQKPNEKQNDAIKNIQNDSFIQQKLINQQNNYNIQNKENSDDSHNHFIESFQNQEDFKGVNNLQQKEDDDYQAYQYNLMMTQKAEQFLQQKNSFQWQQNDFKKQKSDFQSQKNQDFQQNNQVRVIDNNDFSSSPANKLQLIRNQFKKNKVSDKNQSTSQSPNTSFQKQKMQSDRALFEQSQKENTAKTCFSQKDDIYNSPQIIDANLTSKKKLMTQSSRSKSPNYLASSLSTSASIKNKDVGYIEKIIQKNYQNQFQNIFEQSNNYNTKSTSTYRILHNTENDPKPFQPQISKRSQQIAMEKNKDTSPAFIRLHNQKIKTFIIQAEPPQNENFEQTKQNLNKEKASDKSNTTSKKLSQLEIMEMSERMHLQAKRHEDKLKQLKLFYEKMEKEQLQQDFGKLYIAKKSKSPQKKSHGIIQKEKQSQKEDKRTADWNQMKQNENNIQQFYYKSRTPERLKIQQNLNVRKSSQSPIPSNKSKTQILTPKQQNKICYSPNKTKQNNTYQPQQMQMLLSSDNFYNSRSPNKNQGKGHEHLAYRSDDQVKMSHMTIHTLKIDSLRKQKRINDIFTVLDSDADGFISSNKINVTALPPPLLKIISPILYEMEEYNFNLSYEDFIGSIQLLEKVINFQSFSNQISQNLIFYQTLSDKQLEILYYQTDDSTKYKFYKQKQLTNIVNQFQKILISK